MEGPSWSVTRGFLVFKAEVCLLQAWEPLTADWADTFTFIKRLFSSSSLCAIRVVSSAYLRLLIFIGKDPDAGRDWGHT